MIYLTLAVLMVFSIVRHTDVQASEADLIIINGKVITVDKDFSLKQAIAVRDGWIVAVGTNADIQKFAGKKTQVMDLQGKAILPGINESHGHPTAFASVRPPFAIDARYPTVKSLADIKTAVAAKAKELLLSMNGKLPMLRHLEVGIDVIRSERSFDVALYTKFDSLPDLQAYQVHPYHADVVAAYMKANSAAVATADYES